MISRRQFVNATGAALGASVLANRPTGAIEALSYQSQTAQSKQPLMYLGTQKGSSEEMLRFFKRYGVNNICGNPERWSVDGLKQLKEKCAASGITVDMVPLGMPRSVGLVGDKDHRDQQIEQTREQIQMAAEAGIPAIKYNMTVLDVLRTGSTLGRGGSRYSTWVYEKAPGHGSPTRAGQFPTELFWDRISYFLERVIPAATECKVRMACHPHDPGVPSTGYRGVQRVLGTVDGLKRFVEISASPFHGLNFCVGTIASNLNNPAEEMLDVVRYFGRKRKIFNVHFRNIRGKRDNFQEVYVDEGDIDMYGLMRALREIGYSGMIMPDHVPTHPDDQDQFQGFAFTLGYIKALIQTVHAESQLNRSRGLPAAETT